MIYGIIRRQIIKKANWIENIKDIYKYNEQQIYENITME